jgi:hypothetical protein
MKVTGILRRKIQRQIKKIQTSKKRRHLAKLWPLGPSTIDSLLLLSEDIPLLETLTASAVRTKHFFENKIHLFQKLKDYLPIIIQDRDWDHHFFWVLMKFKISRMKELFDNHGHGLNNKKIVLQLEYAEHLISRIIESDDTDSIHSKKFKSIKNPSEKEWEYLSRMKRRDVKALFELIMENYEGWWD